MTKAEIECEQVELALSRVRWDMARMCGRSPGYPGAWHDYCSFLNHHLFEVLCG